MMYDLISNLTYGAMVLGVVLAVIGVIDVLSNEPEAS